LRLYQRKDGMGKPVRNFCTKWHTDATRAQRVPLRHLENGEVFRFLNKYGKPFGPRYVIVDQYDEPNNDYPFKATYYYIYKDVVFTEVDKTERLSVQGGSNVVVKPCHGVAMLVLSKLNSLAAHNYFPA
jgi:hypothetical protein